MNDGRIVCDYSQVHHFCIKSAAVTWKWHPCGQITDSEIWKYINPFPCYSGTYPLHADWDEIGYYLKRNANGGCISLSMSGILYQKDNWKKIKIFLCCQCMNCCQRYVTSVWWIWNSFIWLVTKALKVLISQLNYLKSIDSFDCFQQSC